MNEENAQQGPTGADEFKGSLLHEVVVGAAASGIVEAGKVAISSAINNVKQQQAAPAAEAPAPASPPPASEGSE